MKNVYYLSALVLKIQYTQKFEDKYKQNESLSSLSRLGWVIFFWWVTFKSLKTWMSHFQVSQDLDESFSSLETWMSHFQASQDLDESFSSLSRLGWVTFKSLKTWSRKTLMRSGKKRNRKPKFHGDCGDLCRGQGGKRDEKGPKKKFNFFHRTCGMCGELTAQPHVRRTCGPVRHPWMI